MWWDSQCVSSTIFFQYFVFHVIVSCMSKIVPYFRNYSFQKFGFRYNFFFPVSISKLVYYYLIIMLLFMGILF
jgi:hypothetical protein